MTSVVLGAFFPKVPDEAENAAAGESRVPRPPPGISPGQPPSRLVLTPLAVVGVAVRRFRGVRWYKEYGTRVHHRRKDQDRQQCVRRADGCAGRGSGGSGASGDSGFVLGCVCLLSAFGGAGRLLHCVCCVLPCRNGHHGRCQHVRRPRGPQCGHSQGYGAFEWCCNASIAAAHRPSANPCPTGTLYGIALTWVTYLGLLWIVGNVAVRCVGAECDASDYGSPGWARRVGDDAPEGAYTTAPGAPTAPGAHRCAGVHLGAHSRMHESQAASFTTS